MSLQAVAFQNDHYFASLKQKSSQIEQFQKHRTETLKRRFAVENTPAAKALYTWQTDPSISWTGWDQYVIDDCVWMQLHACPITEWSGIAIWLRSIWVEQCDRRTGVFSRVITDLKNLCEGNGSSLLLSAGPFENHPDCLDPNIDDFAHYPEGAIPKHLQDWTMSKDDLIRAYIKRDFVPIRTEPSDSLTLGSDCVLSDEIPELLCWPHRNHQDVFANFVDETELEYWHRKGATTRTPKNASPILPTSPATTATGR